MAKTAPLGASKKRKRGQKLSKYQQEREALPIYQSKDVIIKSVQQHQTIVLVGETGSGKTTQIPQLLHKVYRGKRIVITQPRRVAAISIAKRVANEMECKLGDTVGYQIRFDDTSSSETMIKFVTDGILLRELLNDPKLSKYGVIILDEAHERTLRTDILFGAIKGILEKRKDLKLMIMSATLNAGAFSRYFNEYVPAAHSSAPIINIPGRQHSVSVFYAPEKLNDYLDACLTTVLQIHKKETESGDILVFLTGQEEIENLEILLLEQAKTLPPTCLKLLVCPLFASLPTSQQTRVFDQTPAGCRKVVLATNIAETSITISGIRHVVDTGLVKMRGYNSKTGIETLNVTPISKAAANQRAGRAGREAPGSCYRLYTEPLFNSLDEESIPEIKRCNLSSVILLLKSSGINDIVGFDFMDKPSRAALVGALEQLYALGALDDKGLLTPAGRQMSLFPVDPTFSKVLIQSKSLKCTQEAIDIVSMLSVDPVFFTPNDKRDEVALTKKRFMSFDGDHVTLLNVLRAYQEVSGDPDWCQSHFVNARSMKQIMDIRKQLIAFCQEQRIDPLVSCGQEHEALIKCFLSGFFKNVAIRQHDGTFKTLLSREIVYIHPSSVLFQTKQPLVMFTEWVKTTRQYLRNVSLIQPSWLSEVAPHIYARNSMTTL
ncbi:putative ATP-dependent RNA helicase dhx33 [Kappamyces sp. JEL0680]|nr:putative ATP-dependent RNA helicase dhx33 [Kappamyces sp. JEL0680]